MPFPPVVPVVYRKLLLGLFILGLPLYGTLCLAPDWQWLAFTVFYALVFLKITQYCNWLCKSIVLAFSLLPFFSVSVLLLVSYALQGVGFNEAFYYHFNSLGIRGHEYTVLFLSGIAVCYYLLLCLLTLTLPGGTKTKSSSRCNAFSALAMVVLFLLSPPALSFFTMYCEAHDYQWCSLLQTAPSGEPDPGVTSLLQGATDPFTYQVQERKNLVFIYAESLEANFFNHEIFPGQFNSLDELQKHSFVFTNMYQTAYTGWTIAGMVASLCGTPLQMPLDSSSNNFNLYNEFMANGECITDLLKDEGYAVSFMGGADLDFAGKKPFLQTHGFEKITGRKHWLSIYDENEREYNPWGIRDRVLFHETWNEFLSLSKTERPFAQFMLTLDTHAPGYPDPECPTTYSPIQNNTMVDAVHCSTLRIHDFIKSIRRSRFSEQTVIVIMSDHLAHASPADPLLRQKKRKLMVMINLPSGQHLAVDAPGTHYDIGPTVLQAIGLTNDQPYGFGHNMLLKEGQERPGVLPALFGVDQMYSVTRNQRIKAFVRSLWGEHLGALGTKGIEINAADYSVRLGDMQYSFRDPHPFKTSRAGALLFILNRDDLQLNDVVSLKDFVRIPDGFSIAHWFSGSGKLYIYVGSRKFLPFLDLKDKSTENVVVLLNSDRETGTALPLAGTLDLSRQQIVEAVEQNNLTFTSPDQQSNSYRAREKSSGISLLSCLNQSCATHIEDKLHNIYRKTNWRQGLSVCVIAENGTVQFITHIDSQPAAYGKAPDLNSIVAKARQEHQGAVVLIAHDSLCLTNQQQQSIARWSQPFSLPKLENIRCHQPYIGIIPLGDEPVEEYTGTKFVQVTL